MQSKYPYRGDSALWYLAGKYPELPTFNTILNILGLSRVGFVSGNIRGHTGPSVTVYT